MSRVLGEVKSPKKIWIFLRGLTREEGHWAHFLEAWQRQHPEDALVALNLPGAGDRRLERAPVSIPVMADQVRDQYLELKRQQGWREDLWTGFLTLSQGAMTAWSWCSRYPQEAQALILMNMSLGGLSLPWQRMNFKLWPELPGLFLAPMEKRELKILSWISNQSPLSNQSIELWCQIQRERPVTLHNTLHQLLAAARFRFQQSLTPRCPMLILASLQDRLVSHTCSEKIARAISAPIRIHPEAGHDLPMDAPEWILEETQKWIKSL